MLALGINILSICNGVRSLGCVDKALVLSNYQLNLLSCGAEKENNINHRNAMSRVVL